MHFQAQKYLARMTWDTPVVPNLETLRDLHFLHLLHFPFENLDIHWGRAIVLDRDKLFTKMLENGRGGFCYELNGLFYELLHALGYQVQLLSARVYEPTRKEYGPPHDHLALLVTLGEEKWLADVGFGDFIRQPLRLVEGLEQKDPRGSYRLARANSGQSWEVQSLNDQGTWLPEYRFEEIAREMGEFEEMCRYHQSDPRSHFLQKKVCTLARHRGRYTLSSTKMRIHRDGEGREEMLVQDEEHFKQLLAQYFTIHPPEGLE